MVRRRPGRPRKSASSVTAPDNTSLEQQFPSVDASSPDPVSVTAIAPPSAHSQVLALQQQHPPNDVASAQDDQHEFSQLQQLVGADPQLEMPQLETSHDPPAPPAGKKRRGRKADTTQAAKRKKDDAGTAVPVVEPQEEEFRSDGPFSESEKTMIDRFVTSFSEQYGLGQEAFNSLIQNKERKLDELSRNLWTQLYLVLPKRDHKAMQRHMRRRFHNFNKRGEWTAEEDEQLKTLHEMHPAKWKWIGEQLGRMAEDCRDRWRNYVVCGEARRTDHWDEKEEEELSIAVHECIREVKEASKERARQNSLAFREDQDWESQINFNNVSAKLNHTRSRLQCLQHWKALQTRDALDKKKRRVNPNKKAKSGTSKGARIRYEQMLPGDKYQILRDIQQFEASDELSIPWAILAQRSPMQWHADDWKYAYTRMKQLAENQADLSVTLTQLLEYMEKNHANELDDKYDPMQNLDPPLHPAPTLNHQTDIAIDPKLQLTDPSALSEGLATQPKKTRRGRKSKQFKSPTYVDSEAAISQPPSQSDLLLQSAPQAPMANVLEHPADHFFQRFTAPTAPMSQMRGDAQIRDGGEPEPPGEGVFMSAEEEAAASLLAAKSMQIMKQNAVGE